MMNLSTALKTANSRFFTDCYPISAAITPPLNQIFRRSVTFYENQKTLIFY